jgi:hypothetical protein
MGPPYKLNFFPGCQYPELKKEKPGQKLGFPPIGMAKSYDAAAFSGKGSLKCLKNVRLPLQNHPGNSQEKDAVESAKHPNEKNDKF